MVAALVAAGLGSSRAADDAERITTLIADLGHKDFERRETAGQELEALGEAALAPLRKAATQDKDFEIRAHAEQLIVAILRASCASKTTNVKFVVVWPGEFSMGAPQTELAVRADQTLHRVRITRPYLIATHEVTQRQYEQLMKVNPSGFAKARAGAKENPDPMADKVKGIETDDFPVEQVSWYDAIEFCNRLSKADGYAPFYKIENVKREADSILSADVTPLETNGYRLPTEAEWECACRAGTSTPYHYGGPSNGASANLKAQDSVVAYGGTVKGPNLGRTTKVGSYKPNAWGLYDMHGNVWEWCWDWYGFYEGGPVRDPRGPAEGRQRLQRGGAWLISEQSCRSASRLGVAPGERKNHIGFRVARSP